MAATILEVIFYVRHIWNAIWTLLVYFFRSCILRVPVSYPGDKLVKPITRKGQWPKRSLRLESGWLFASDAQSHEESQKAAPKYAMTGESAGRQIWYFDKKCGNQKQEGVNEDQSFDPSQNPNSGDKIFRNIMLRNWEGPKVNVKKPKTPIEAAVKGLSFYQTIQCEDGHWAGDYGGPMFLMPGLICSIYLTKAPLSQPKKDAMILYLRNHQQVDGGWGTHIECASTMFGTVLSYVALRLLGVSPEEDYMRAARDFIREHGGALYAPSWAKFWLAVIGVYHWDGINSIPAEMWFLPRWFPLHPGKMWCHCRMVYLPMCYVYCKRFVPDVKNDPILLGLRSELYDVPYDSIDWDRYRQVCCEIDEYSPLKPVMKVAQDLLSVFEWVLPYIPPLRWFREYALRFVIDYIHAEDIQTNYVDIGPVNKALNMLSVWVDGGCNNNCESFQRHLPRIDDYLWIAEDGMKMQGYNGSQCWDTSFAIQAIVEGKRIYLCFKQFVLHQSHVCSILGGFIESFPDCSRKVYEYLRRTQIATDEDDKELYFRHVSKGGWPFSTAAHGWPISDCTSEGLKAVLAIHEIDKSCNLVPKEARISDERLQDACNVILTLHNADGGWATYENNRGYGWYELLNPSEVFGDIMIDYSYVECTSACITALRTFSSFQPDYRPTEVLAAIQAGRRFIKSIQRSDGSWYGSWGVCFTYATWFGIEGLVAAGEDINSECIVRASKFLLSRQNANGGWGENYLSCVNKDYPEDGTGEVLNLFHLLCIIKI